jgi:hypothetical protein
VDLFNKIRKKLVIFVHFKGFNISQKPKSSPLSYFAQKISLNLASNWYPIIFTCPFRSHSCSYISNINISVHQSISEIAILILSMSLNFIKAWRNDKYNKIDLIWRFTLVLIKINYGQIGDQTGLFHTTNPIFYTSGNRCVRRIGTFGNLWFFHLSHRTTVIQDLLVRRQFSLVPDNRTNVNVEAWNRFLEHSVHRLSVIVNLSCMLF